jgi:hypothetical protein
VAVERADNDFAFKVRQTNPLDAHAPIARVARVDRQ